MEKSWDENHVNPPIDEKSPRLCKSSSEVLLPNQNSIRLIGDPLHRLQSRLETDNLGVLSIINTSISNSMSSSPQDSPFIKKEIESRLDDKSSKSASKPSSINSNSCFLSKRKPEALYNEQPSGYSLNLRPTTGSKMIGQNKSSIIRLLTKIFQKQKILEADINSFCYIDKEIVRSIIKRKFKKIIAIESTQLLQNLNSIQSSACKSRRAEENNKLVFKRAIRELINKSKEEHLKFGTMKNKKFFETKVCEMYFQNPIPCEENLSQSPNRDFTNMDPIQGNYPCRDIETIRQFVFKPKNMNIAYIRYLYNSENFRLFFEEFVSDSFIKNYKRCRGKKVLKLINAIYAMFPEADVAPESVPLAILNYIETSPKFKLPWTDEELLHCVDYTKKLRNRLANPSLTTFRQ